MVSYFTFLIILSSYVKSAIDTNYWGAPRSSDSGGLGWVPQICICIKFPHDAAQGRTTLWEPLTLMGPKPLPSYKIPFFFSLRLHETRRRGWQYWHEKAELLWDLVILLLRLHSTEENDCYRLLVIVCNSCTACNS